MPISERLPGLLFPLLLIVQYCPNHHAGFTLAFVEFKMFFKKKYVRFEVSHVTSDTYSQARSVEPPTKLQGTLGETPKGALADHLVKARDAPAKLPQAEESRAVALAAQRNACR